MVCSSYRTSTCPPAPQPYALRRSLHTARAQTPTHTTAHGTRALQAHDHVKCLTDPAGALPQPRRTAGHAGRAEGTVAQGVDGRKDGRRGEHDSGHTIDHYLKIRAKHAVSRSQRRSAHRESARTLPRDTRHTQQAAPPLGDLERRNQGRSFLTAVTGAPPLRVLCSSEVTRRHTVTT